MIVLIGACSIAPKRKHGEKMQHPITQSMTLERLLVLPLSRGGGGWTLPAVASRYAPRGSIISQS